MKHRKTHRGFNMVEFKDNYGENCSIQESSAVEDDCIWLGIDEVRARKFTPYGDPSWEDYQFPRNVHLFGRMHLSREQVKSILPILEHFAEYGVLPG